MPDDNEPTVPDTTSANPAGGADTPPTPPPPAPEAPPDPAVLLEAERARADAAERRAGRLERERDAARIGIVDPEGVDIAELLYGRLPEQDRPAFGAWVAALQLGAAPKGLALYLPAPPPAATPPAAPPPAAPPPVAAPPPAPPPPAAPPPAAPPPAAPPPVVTSAASGAIASTIVGAAGETAHVTAGELAAARRDAVRTGDYARLRELQTRFEAQLVKR